MASAPDYLSLQQFEQLYEKAKPHYEYWFGEVIQKPMPTSLHGLVQLVLGMLLLKRGWYAGSEVRLKISALAHPVPDLVASSIPLQAPYPEKPVELCVEILSPDDILRDIFRKGAHYLDWQIRDVWIFDPEKRTAYSMSLTNPQPIELAKSDSLTAGSGDRAIKISLTELFSELDHYLDENSETR
jgi:Uma2 family endonuclease